MRSGWKSSHFKRNPNDQEFHMRAKHFHLHRFHSEFKARVGYFGEASNSKLALKT